MVAFVWQNPPDADIIFRASGWKESHAHKFALSLASLVFRDMFFVPQPPDGPSKTPIIDVDGPPDAPEMFLRMVYPVRTPSISDAEALASLLRLDKYDVEAILDAHKDYLPSAFINTPHPRVRDLLCL